MNDLPKHIRAAALFMATTLMVAFPVLAQRPSITSARVYETSGVVTVDLHCGQVFSEKVVGTVQSGLPVVVELLYALRSKGNNTVARGVRSYELNYDVWENTYSVTTGDTVVSVPGFEGMQGMVRRLKGISVIPLSRLKKNDEYYVRMRVAVHPLGSGERISGWVDDNVRRKTTWREQVLNLNDLISKFFSGDKATSNESEWFDTYTFQAGLLPRIAKEVSP